MVQLIWKIFSGLAVENFISGPSDAGGICPQKSYKFTKYNKEICCCEHGCCWDRCLLKVPPNDCLKEDNSAVWEFNKKLKYYQAKTGGKTNIVSTIINDRVTQFLENIHSTSQPTM